MFKGFYNLTSGMLTHQRNLNTVANNMVNASTAGYKTDTYTSSTFDEVLLSRVGNKDKSNAQVIGGWSYIRASSEMYTDFSQGLIEPTGIPLDFAIEGDGFFAVQMADGTVGYTRTGSFSLDDEGYLCLPGQGRVLDAGGQPIMLGTDKIRGDQSGLIYSEYGPLLAQLGVYTFDDTGVLQRNDQGLFVGAQGNLMGAPTVHWASLERSNVDLVRQMTEMLSTQRAFQSVAQVSKMYDELMTKTATDIGRV